MIEFLIGLGVVMLFCILIAWQPWRPKWEEFVRPPHDWTARGDKENPPRKV